MREEEIKAAEEKWATESSDGPGIDRRTPAEASAQRKQIRRGLRRGLSWWQRPFAVRWIERQVGIQEALLRGRISWNTVTREGLRTRAEESNSAG